MLRLGLLKMNHNHSEIISSAREYILAALGPERGAQAFSSVYSISSEKKRADWCVTMVKELEHRRLDKQGIKPVTKELLLRYDPVDVRTFVEDKYFLDAKNILYPVVMDSLIEMNNGEYQEVVLTGAIGVGKTTLALYSIAYQLYILSCYKNPHALYELDPSSEIVFIFQSINAKLAKSIDFDRFKAMIERCPYFAEHFKFQKDILSELRFPNRIIVKPITGSETGAIGQNIISGVIDEMNFMSIIENSKSSDDGGTYNQAMALYNSIADRRKSRFMVQGKLPGLLCLVSSKRFPGQFTDLKEEESKREIERTGKTTIYVYDKRSWDIKPASKFSGKWFKIFIGDESRRPRFVEPTDVIATDDLHLYMDIPEEYRTNFEADMMKALRNIAAVSTLSLHPFIQDRSSVVKAMRSDHIMFSREDVDFQSTRLEVDPNMFLNPELPRFVHIDLAITGDSAGVAIGMVPSFVQVGDPLTGVVQMLPKIWIDGVLEVKPPKGGEILFYKIRETIQVLKKQGLNIRWVTLDSFQSVDTLQLLRQMGFLTGCQSMDTSTSPYESVKNALYEGRLSIPMHKKLASELIGLEKDMKRNKIDHPSTGSKDISDALAGVVYGLTTRREIWAMYGVSLFKIPDSIRILFKKEEAKVA